MKATRVGLVLLLMAMAAVAVAQPVHPVAVPQRSIHALEPVWMLLSGAILLGIASAVRRYVP